MLLMLVIFMSLCVPIIAVFNKEILILSIRLSEKL